MNILVIGPHPDDQEIGMGGTIAKLADLGHDVLLLDMTDGSPTPQGERASRLVEAQEALEHLRPQARAPEARPAGRVERVLLDLPNRRVEHTIEARHRVASIIRAHQASVLFMPHPEDAHPDHLATTRIAEDARFDAKLTKVEMPAPPPPLVLGPLIYPKWVFYYYCSHLRRVADPTFLMDTTGYEQSKRRAIESYRTQFALNLLNRDFPGRVGSYDEYFGSRIGTRSAEPFWTREPLGLSDLRSLV